jgi:tricorn protease
MTIGYYRFPALAHDAIVFVCEDDLWTVPRSGGIARRLTTGRGDIATPKLSPDGRSLAFVAREEGHPEVYVMPAAGGEATRLTYLGGEACIISGWTPDGASILFASDAVSPFVKETMGFSVPAAGGAPQPLGLGQIRTLSLAPDGRLAIGRNNEDPARWKRYRGGTAGDLWIDAAGTGTFSRLVSLAGNVVWPMWIGERVFFLSDHEGIGNLYSVRPDGSDLRRHTDEAEYYVRFPSTDGSSIVYAAGAELRILDPASGRIETISIEAPSGSTQTTRRFLEIADELSEFAPSPDGTSLALVARGVPVTMPLWEEAAISHGAGSSVRYRLVAWLPDGKRFACVSDAEGRERIELHDASGEKPPVAITSEDIGRITELAASPAGEIVALANHRHELLLVDLEERRVRTLDRSPASRIRDLAFSPDGRWLAYACATDSGWVGNAESSIIRIAKVKSGAVHDATPQMREDRSPAWDPEGKYLFFISSRDFNPVYDALQFDLSFPLANRPYAIALRADLPSPFVAKPAPLHKEHKDDDDAAEKKGDRPARIAIDFDGIHGRIIAFPVEEGNYGELVAAKGRVLFTKFPVKGIKPGASGWDEDEESGTLFAYDFEQQRSAVFQSDAGEIRLGADGRTLAYSSHGRLRVVDALGDLSDDGPDDPKTPAESGRRTGWIDLGRTHITIEPRAEWAQMYQEAWRMQREQFWDATMTGIDWDLVRSRYARLLPRVRTRGELSDLMWEMLGELGTSHAYEIGGDRRVPPAHRRGFLGADLAYDESAKGYRILTIYRGDSWNREIDSPLAEPGTLIHEGDVILAINGRRLSRTVSPDAALVNSAAREIALTIAGPGKESRRVVVRTLRDERMLRYRAWVEANRTLVHGRTEGRVGYVHIPDMGPWGFSEFHRGFLSEFNREGLIVDVRYNRGGHVSPLLLEKLARRRVGYDVSRYGPPMPYPPESPVGPLVALTNQFAGSDGDIFSHCFKLYGLGPLVGKRTWGGVIGINPYHSLVDGTITTQPEYSFWFTDVGWKVENYGTDPDFDVDIAPHDERDGRDPQMEKALELMAALRSANGFPRPQLDGRPSLAIPTTLPPRP